jgi:exopolysaccharide production protein ExoZ
MGRSLGQLSNIQILRGIAALSVVVFHAQEELREKHLGDPFPNLIAGAFGVDLFFAISGFIMVYSSVAAFGVIKSAAPFMLRRIIRIAPLYWIITGLFAIYVLHQTRHNPDHHNLLVNAAASVAFVSYLSSVNPDGGPVYSLGWTLEYEMFFYLCFAAFLALRRRLAVIGLAIAFSILVIAGQTLPMPDWGYILASTQILEFVAGMILAELYLAELRIRPLAALVLIAGGLVGVFLTAPTMDDWSSLRGLVWGPFAAFILAGVAFAPSRGAWLRKWFEAMGDASYSLYLVHYVLFIAISLCVREVLDFSRIPAVIYFAVLVSASIACAFATHHLVEAPMTRMLQRKAARMGRHPSSTT